MIPANSSINMHIYSGFVVFTIHPIKINQMISVDTRINMGL